MPAPAGKAKAKARGAAKAKRAAKAVRAPKTKSRAVASSVLPVGQPDMTNLQIALDDPDDEDFPDADGPHLEISRMATSHTAPVPPSSTSSVSFLQLRVWLSLLALSWGLGAISFQGCCINLLGKTSHIVLFLANTLLLAFGCDLHRVQPQDVIEQPLDATHCCSSVFG